MKNVICPISKDKIPSHLPRVTAFFVVLTVIVYALTQWFPLVLFLTFDFTARATNNGNLSFIHFVSKATSNLIQLKSDLIDKAPKLFAARLGAFMFAGATILHIAELNTAASIIALLIGVLASLEWLFNICVGCYIYYGLIYPFYAKK